MRVTPSVKRLLDSAAEKSGRSQSQEAEMRLEMSFRDQALVHDQVGLAYGYEAGSIVLLIAEAMHSAGQLAAFRASGSMENWLDDAAGYDAAMKAAQRILEEFRPAGEANARAMELVGIDLAYSLANGLIEEVARGASRTGDPGHRKFVAAISENLGAVRDRIKHRAMGQTADKEAWGGEKEGT